MKQIEERVIKFVDENNLISPGDRLLIGLSGGPDSVFALYFFNKFKKLFKVAIYALHINHLLRGVNSDKDEEFSKNICRKLNLEFASKQVDINKIKLNSNKSVEEIAREERYKHLVNHAVKFEADKIITAHNQDDNTETVLLNLIKGAGIQGLSGIPIKRENIIRPLLCLSKNEILDYLKANKIRYRIDKSNLENDYQRNFLRNKIIPKLIDEINPSLHQSVFRSSSNFSSLNKGLKVIVNDHADNAWFKRNDKYSLKLKQLEDLNAFMIDEIIIYGLKKYYSPKITSKDVAKIKKLMESQVGKSVKLRDSFTAVREREKIIVQREQSSEFEGAHLKIGKPVKTEQGTISVDAVRNPKVRMNQKGIEYVSIDNEKPVFKLVRWKSGDKFKPLGMNQFKKVSDFLTDLKIPASEKKSKLVLKYRNQIVWIVGLRIDDRFKLTTESKKVYRLCHK